MDILKTHSTKHDKENERKDKFEIVIEHSSCLSFSSSSSPSSCSKDYSFYMQFYLKENRESG